MDIRKKLIGNFKYSVDSKIRSLFSDQINLSDLKDATSADIPVEVKGLNELEDKLYPILQKFMMNKINTGIFPQEITFKVASILQSLKNMEAASIQMREIGFNKNILLRTKQDTNNFVDILELYLNRKVTNEEEKWLYMELAKENTMSEKNIEDILMTNTTDTSLTNADILNQFFKTLCKKVWEKFGLFIVIINKVPTFNINNFSFHYNSDMTITDIHFVYNWFVRDTKNLYFDPMIHVNLEDPEKNNGFRVNNNVYISYILSKLNIVSKKVDEKNKPPMENIREIIFDPFDRNEDLPVIEVDIGSYKKTFLLGKSNNLYEDDDKLNNLVGKIEFLDDKYNSARIYWCKDYKLI
jgi:hypothetical protein